MDRCKGVLFTDVEHGHVGRTMRGRDLWALPLGRGDSISVHCPPAQSHEPNMT